MSEKRERSRQGRATAQQIEALISYLEKHPEVASGKFTTMNAHDSLEKHLQDLATHLNSLVPQGKGKDVKSWKTTWRDHKSKVSEKVQKIRKGRAATGNNPVQIILTELDKRILGIIGNDYIQGLRNVPDSFPEEHNNAIEELTAGNVTLLNDAPAPIVIAELPQETNAEFDANDFNVNIPFEQNCHEIQDAANENEIQNDIDENEIQYENITQAASTSTSTCIPLQENRGQKRKRTRSVRTERLSMQLADARETFEDIANKHAEAMKTLSEAMQLQAEATNQLSNAIDRIARNEERQTKILEIIFDLLNKETT